MTVAEFVDAAVNEQGLSSQASMRFACLNKKMIPGEEMLLEATTSEDDIFIWAVEDPKTRLFRLCQTYQTSMRTHHRVKFSTKHEKIRQDCMEEFEVSVCCSFPFFCRLLKSLLSDYNDQMLQRADGYGGDI
jgi:hypothetical protein